MKAALIAAVTLLSLLRVEAASDAAWTNVTGNVGGPAWGFAGVCVMAAVPGSNEILAGVSEQGIWSSIDDGKTWTKLAAGDKEQIKHRPGYIIFDPKNPKTFWVAGCYSASPFKTTDGGKTFARLGNLSHTDGVAIDFSDPERKTLVIGLHEQVQSIHKSTDGGKTWTKIGDKLPANTNHSTDAIVIDAKTYIVNTAGWAKASWGIYRTEDAGASFTKVSDAGPSGRPLIASDGAIYWAITWGGGLLKSTDKGKTWTKLDGPVKSTPIEIPGGKLVAAQESQLYISTDQGATWKPFGPKLPYKVNGVTYSEKTQNFYAWRSSGKKVEDAVVRCQIAE